MVRVLIFCIVGPFVGTLFIIEVVRPLFAVHPHSIGMLYGWPLGPAQEFFNTLQLAYIFFSPVALIAAVVDWSLQWSRWRSVLFLGFGGLAAAIGILYFPLTTSPYGVIWPFAWVAGIAASVCSIMTASFLCFLARVRALISSPRGTLSR